MANVGIWQKETLIAEGKPVIVALAPVDPRSLMQGDYMRLDFQLVQLANNMQNGRVPVTRLRAIAKIDQHGIATFARIDAGTPLAPGELAIELKQRGGAWSIGTDAWYFKEGEADRWARARYGEFRVDASGRTLLVGMRGPNLEPL